MDIRYEQLLTIRASRGVSRSIGGKRTKITIN